MQAVVSRCSKCKICAERSPCEIFADVCQLPCESEPDEKTSALPYSESCQHARGNASTIFLPLAGEVAI
eukprot:12935454-Prorocentrum_lima.AAC.1